MDIWRRWKHPRQKPPFGARIDWSDPITDGLVGCWLFNEQVGTVLNNLAGDESSNRIGADFVSSGVYISRYEYCLVASSDNLRPKNNFSIFALVFPVIIDGAKPIVMHDDNGNGDDGYMLRFDTNDGPAHVAFGAFNGAGFTAQRIGGTTTISTNYWWFVGGSYSASYEAKVYVNGKVDNVEQKSGDARYEVFDNVNIGRRGGVASPDSEWFNGIIALVYFFRRVLTDNEIERLHYEPYSFFLVPAARIFDLAPASGGQTYFYEGNIPLSLLPSHAKEVRYYPPLGGAPIVLTPQGQVKASYQKEGSQQISLTPQADIKATYVKDGLVLMQIAVAAEKQAKYSATGEIPINLQVQGEKKALYEKSGVLSFSLLPFSRVQATYAKEGSVSFSLALESDIACTFRVEGSVGFILLPQGSWTYVPATGGVVYTYEGNIPIALVPEADVKALYKKQGGLFLSLSPASSWQAKYRHVGELLLSLIPAGEKQASFLIEGEIQLHLVPEGVAVVIKPSGQEELFVVGIIEEDDLRAVFDGAVHGDIWPRK